MQTTTWLTLGMMLVGVSPTPSLARQAENSREAQGRMLEYERKVLLAMVDSMPERLYRDKATPAQRDFAQQIQHAAGVAGYIVGAILKGPKAPAADTATTLNSRAALRRYVSAVFDNAAAHLKAQSAPARAETVDLFGQKMPAWQVWDEIYTHTVWTAGSVVANFRKNGMAPPEFTFF
jgi:hypothetical protein